MRRYRVIIEDSAQADIERSYQWGVRHWGKVQAQEWARQLRQACRQLATMPSRNPIAPENEEFNETIRHLVSGRYRVLFTIRTGSVHVLHVRGPFKGDW
ncbi:MAG TPA: type II toxin-antitoxin system RelE/ParE family toxin [Blastocatellia bacterium]|nr:type II toxin-antitoxin system RelE/ParE family toxin [Blastocatellia bacterium]